MKKIVVYSIGVALLFATDGLALKRHAISFSQRQQKEQKEKEEKETLAQAEARKRAEAARKAEAAERARKAALAEQEARDRAEAKRLADEEQARFDAEQERERVRQAAELKAQQEKKRKEDEAKAEAERLEREQQEQAAERARKAALAEQEARDRAEAKRLADEEQARFDAEQERVRQAVELKAQQEKKRKEDEDWDRAMRLVREQQEADRAAEAKRLADEEQERERQAAELKEQQEKKRLEDEAKAEAERLAREQQEKADREAEVKRLADEAKAAKEQADKDEAERLAREKQLQDYRELLAARMKEARLKQAADEQKAQEEKRLQELKAAKEKAERDEAERVASDLDFEKATEAAIKASLAQVEIDTKAREEREQKAKAAQVAAELKAQQDAEAKAKRDEEEKKRVAALPKAEREAEIFSFMTLPPAPPRSEREKKEKEAKEKEVKEREVKEKESKYEADQRRVAAGSTLAESARSQQQVAGRGAEELRSATALSLGKGFGKKKEDEKKEGEKKESREERAAAAKLKREEAVDKELKGAVDALGELFAELSRLFTTFVASLTVHSSGRNYYTGVFEGGAGIGIYGCQRAFEGSGQKEPSPEIIRLALFYQVRKAYDSSLKHNYERAGAVYSQTLYKLLLQRRVVENELKHAVGNRHLVSRKELLDRLLADLARRYENCILPITQFKAMMVKKMFIGLKRTEPLSRYDKWLTVDRGDLVRNDRSLRGEEVFARMGNYATIFETIAVMPASDFYTHVVRRQPIIGFRGEEGVDAGGLRREFVGLFLAPYFSAVKENKDEEGNDVVSSWFFDHDKDRTYALPKDLSELAIKASQKGPDQKSIEAAQKKVLEIADAEKKLAEEIKKINAEEYDKDPNEDRTIKDQKIARLNFAFAGKRKQLEEARKILKAPEIRQEFVAQLEKYQIAFKALGRVLFMSLANELPMLLPLSSSSFLALLEKVPSASHEENLPFFMRLLYEYGPADCGPFLEVIAVYDQARAAGYDEKKAAEALQKYAVDKDILEESDFATDSWKVVLNKALLKRLHVWDQDREPSRSLQAMTTSGLVISDDVVAEKDFDKIDLSEQKLLQVGEFLTRGTQLRDGIVHDLQVELLPSVMCMHLQRVWAWLTPEDCVYGLFASEIDAVAVKRGLEPDLGRLDGDQKSAANLFIEAVREYLDENTKQKDDEVAEVRKKQNRLADFVQYICGARAYDGRSLKLAFITYARGVYYAHTCFNRVDIDINAAIQLFAPGGRLETRQEKNTFKQNIKDSIAAQWKGGSYTQS